jgi:hypothetical protein
MQASVGGAEVLGFTVWADKVNYDKAGRAKGHPLTMGTGAWCATRLYGCSTLTLLLAAAANHAVVRQHKQDARKMLAMLPVVQPTEDAPEGSKALQERKRVVLQYALSLALAPLRKAADE